MWAQQHRGQPMAALLLSADCTVTITHSHTPAEDLPAICREADILVAATGKAGLITSDFINSDQVILDVGISRTADGKIVGDVDFATVEPLVKAITLFRWSRPDDDCNAVAEYTHFISETDG